MDYWINKSKSMEDFFPGDTVEFLSDKTRGIIVSLPDKQTIMIDLGGGFEIPVGRNEVIKVDQSNQIHSSSPLLTEKPAKTVENKGIFLAVNSNETLQNHELFIVNSFNEPYYFTFYKYSGNIFNGVCKGELPQSSFKSIFKIAFKEAGNQNFLIQLLAFYPETNIKPGIIEFIFNLDKEIIRNEKTYSSVLMKEVLMIPILEAKKPEIPKIQTPEPEPVINIEEPEHIIDLHIEEINPAYKLMTRNEMYNFQFTYFVNALEKGIALNYNSMIFIHGIGVSSLKNRIHEYLKGHDHIKSFGDADVRKFGYGATRVDFK
jgi:hypothetical protein